MYDIVLLFIFNILTMQNDGMPQNWEIEEGPNGVSLVPIFDNEYSLRFNQAGGVYSKLTTNFKDYDQDNYAILEEFLKISSKEFIDLFIEKFNSLTLDAFLEILNIVELKIECEIPVYLKNIYINAFKANKESISSILEKFKLNGNSLK